MKYVDQYTKEISFPLGGIGTGCIGLAGDGRLIDWEIFNRPAKGTINGYSHFAIKAIKGGKPITYVLCGDILKDYTGSYRDILHSGYGFGPHFSTLGGLPHFSNIEFNGEFPVAKINYHDDNFPGKVSLTAFNPFIPNDAKNSSLPAAFFQIEIFNTSDETIKYQLATSVRNPFGKSYNKAKETGNYTTIFMKNAELAPDDLKYGDMTVATDCEKAYTQSYWYRGRWQDGIVSFWSDFNSVENIKERNYDTYNDYDTSSLVSEVEIKPGELKKIKIVLSWNIPYTYNYWNECRNEDGTHKAWKNYYATVFENSFDTAKYALDNWNDLYKRTMQFKNELHSMTLPQEVIDAASANLSVLKSPTVLRLEDGSFYGWEGVHVDSGSCEGTCQHVWNYAYALCFLFSELERSIRDLEFKYSTDFDGRMGFRLQLPIGRKMSQRRACVDGQMGAVIKCYREWKISGNDTWLNDNWENIKRVLEYAWSSDNCDLWDYDKDGVLEGRQHHTLDMELFGPSSWLEGFYLAALKAAAEMAEYLNDLEKAKEYREMFEKGYKWTKENLFNGKYFIHKCDISDKSIVDKFGACDEYWNEEVKQIKYQICEGSIIDQVLAQWHADLLGLGDIFDKEQVNAALSNMMKNNYKESMRYFANPWRLFSLNDESGTVICDYPDGVEKPRIPVPYCEETMTGFEYSFAGLLCSRGKIDDGLKVVKAVRDRFDGNNRNPWNEFECGSNYARAMASYALIPILSGFEFDMPHHHIGFNPCKVNDFKCIWSLADAWGNFEVNNNTVRINVYEGEINLKSLSLKFCNKISNVKIDGKDIDFEFENGIIYFKETSLSKYVEIIL
ncbi:MAG: hypothetical protein II997_00010 [Clostridia bacterium]|nr:hypothetical protein [Clostridia bacterium]